MTPKEKAEELVGKIGNVQIYIDIEPTNISERIKDIDSDLVKQCALIAVDEILEDRERLEDAFFYDGNYWQEVRNEIDKINNL